MIRPPYVSVTQCGSLEHVQPGVSRRRGSVHTHISCRVCNPGGGGRAARRPSFSLYAAPTDPEEGRNIALMWPIKSLSRSAEYSAADEAAALVAVRAFDEDCSNLKRFLSNWSDPGDSAVKCYASLGIAAVISSHRATFLVSLFVARYALIRLHSVFGPRAETKQSDMWFECGSLLLSGFLSRCCSRRTWQPPDFFSSTDLLLGSGSARRWYRCTFCFRRPSFRHTASAWKTKG